MADRAEPNDLTSYRAKLVELRNAWLAIHPENFDVEMVCTIRQSITTLTQVLVEVIDRIEAERLAQEAAADGRRYTRPDPAAHPADS